MGQNPSAVPNNLLEIGNPSMLDAVGDERGFLVDDKNGNYVRLSPSAYWLFRAVETGMSFEALAQTLNTRQHAPSVSPGQLREAYGRIREKLHTLEGKSTKNILPFGFWLRIPMIPRALVIRISKALSFFYQPWWAAMMLSLIAVSGLDLWKQGIFRASQSDLLAAYGIYLISLAVHEFGHTSACVAFGAEPKEIGFTVYLIYPAFYSDVSSCWRLGRWKRVIVDLGGFYFQLCLGSVFLLAYHWTGWNPLRVTEVIILYTAVFSLNPIFKFDGYWMLTDMLGVTNLGRQPLRIARYFVAHLFHRNPQPLPWSMAISLIVMVYSVISCAVWTIFAVRLVPSVRYQITLLLHSCKAIIYSITMSGNMVKLDVEQLILSILQLTIIAVMLWKLGKRLLAFRFRDKSTAT
jgi:putative peptide zinc metalloprotease protein